jgi:hypothetical protein
MTGAAASNTTGGDSTRWITLQRSFGPVHFNRIGLKYQDSRLSILLDAGLSAGGLTISLNGLAATTPLATFSPSFHLDGLGVGFDEGPVDISGAFPGSARNALEGTKFQYDGAVIVKAADFSPIGLGSYAQLVAGGASLFAFVQLNKALGGPAFFFVLGLAGGFGYNRGLRIPDQNQVMDFPLVKGIDQPSVVGGSDPDPLAVLAVLEGRNGGTPWISTQLGQDWLAAGVQFTSFDIIRSNALLIVEFGKTFEIAVVGLSVAKLPQEGPETYAYVELALRIVLDPAAGLFAASAALTPNSYLLDPACHLTGGFAFYAWFGRDHPGDFVLTLGGYHPDFPIPAWYPREPRLGFNWPVSDSLTIKGEAYFALTPSSVMAGGGLEALYHSGNLQAWFKAYADMIIHWKPFIYSATASVSIGVAYQAHVLGLKKTFRVELGVKLDLWGPPTAGKAHINWYIISFTVAFGKGDKQPDRLLVWDEFKTLLPSQPPRQTDGAARAPAAIALESVVASRPIGAELREIGPALATKTAPDPVVCQVSAQGGLLRQIKNADDTTWWIVRADSFRFASETTIPASEVYLTTPAGGISVPAKNAPGARPLGFSSISAKQTITITNLDTGHVEDFNNWSYTPHTRGVPEALWGAAVDPGRQLAPAATVLPDRLVGIANAGINFQAPAGTPPIAIQAAFGYFMLDQDRSDWLPLSPAAQPPAGDPPRRSDQSLATIQGSIMQDGVAALRTDIFAALAPVGLPGGTNGELNALARQPGVGFAAAPMLGSPTAEPQA